MKTPGNIDLNTPDLSVFSSRSLKRVWTYYSVKDGGSKFPFFPEYLCFKDLMKN